MAHISNHVCVRLPSSIIMFTTTHTLLHYIRDTSKTENEIQVQEQDLAYEMWNAKSHHKTILGLFYEKI